MVKLMVITLLSMPTALLLLQPMHPLVQHLIPPVHFPTRTMVATKPKYSVPMGQDECSLMPMERLLPRETFYLAMAVTYGKSQTLQQQMVAVLPVMEVF